MGRCLYKGKGRYKGDKKVRLYMKGREGDSVMGRCL